LERSILAVSVAYLKIDEVTSCTMTTTPNVDKSRLWQ